MGMSSDDGSESASHYSAGSRSVRSAKSLSRASVSINAYNDKPVLKMRPKKPLISNINDSVLTVSQMLANKCGSA